VQGALDRHRLQVLHIKTSNLLVVTSASEGRYTCRSVKTAGVSYFGCLGAMSCSCPFKGVCKHLQAAADMLPFSHAMRAAAAKELQIEEALQHDEQTGLVSCGHLGDLGMSLPPFVQNLATNFCDCADWMSNRLCAHLMAAHGDPQFAALCECPLPNPEHGPEETIPVARKQPLGMRVGADEPIKCIGGAMQHIKQLEQALPNNDQATLRAPAASSEERAIKREIAKMSASVKYISHPDMQELLPLYTKLAEQTAAKVPALHKVVLQHKGRRRDADRTMKPLYPGRTRAARRSAPTSTAAVDTSFANVAPGAHLVEETRIAQQDFADATPSGTFAKGPSYGRPKTKVRVRACSKWGRCRGDSHCHLRCGYAALIQAGNRTQQHAYQHAHSLWSDGTVHMPTHPRKDRLRDFDGENITYLSCCSMFPCFSTVRATARPTCCCTDGGFWSHSGEG
jgi:hypothetical protein